LHEKKGCDLLVRSFVKVYKDDPDTLLVLAGPDQQGLVSNLTAEAHEAGMKDRLVYLGMLTGEDKWGALAAAEAFALPSHQENFGIAVAEALACGTPVLISDQVNIWREIHAAQGGLVERDDQDGTDRLLSKWRALSAGEKSAFRVRARACFESQFDVREAGRFLIKTLEGLPGHPARSAATSPG
jgi:glycosyltransferase involved in cell wall biosynthesis